MRAFVFISRESSAIPFPCRIVSEPNFVYSPLRDYGLRKNRHCEQYESVTVTRTRSFLHRLDPLKRISARGAVLPTPEASLSSQQNLESFPRFFLSATDSCDRRKSTRAQGRPVRCPQGSPVPTHRKNVFRITPMLVLLCDIHMTCFSHDSFIIPAAVRQDQMA